MSQIINTNIKEDLIRAINEIPDNIFNTRFEPGQFTIGNHFEIEIRLKQENRNALHVEAIATTNLKSGPTTYKTNNLKL